MSMKLVFQDDKGNRVYDTDILCEKSARLPKQGDLVQFADGTKAEVQNRLFVYSDGKGRKSDVQIVFVCKRRGRARWS